MIKFDANPNCGQLNPDERRLLYNTVLEYKPLVAFEVGTWEGGGSTYFIASAMVQNDFGTLYTVECDEECYRKAIDNFAVWPNQGSRVVFNFGRSGDMFPRILVTTGRADLVFLDGCNDAETTRADYMMFLPYMLPGSVLACHDWEETKMDYVRRASMFDGFWVTERQHSLTIMKRK